MASQNGQRPHFHTGPAGPWGSETLTQVSGPLDMLNQAGLSREGTRAWGNSTVQGAGLTLSSTYVMSVIEKQVLAGVNLRTVSNAPRHPQVLPLQEALRGLSTGAG